MAIYAEGQATQSLRETTISQKAIKLVIWDLDNTLWQGTLLEGDTVQLRQHISEILKTLDGRGILNSIASKNEHYMAMAKLHEFGIDEFFIYPKINWNAKSANIAEIVQEIGINADSVAFVDDQQFERAEVTYAIPQIRTFDVPEIDTLISRPEFIPAFITDESAKRRKMYLAEAARKKAETGFTGPQEEFLSTLEMKFTISLATEFDLRRAEELTVRTNQLNTTGRTYSYEELAQLRESNDHLLLIAGLDDKWGPYGKIGLALIQQEPGQWTIKLLLMSCRVMSRGVGTILLTYILSLARDAGVRLLAEFKSNDRNRMMFITYRMAGFHEISTKDDTVLLENSFAYIAAFPSYIKIVLPLQN
jgi:FkbH-like protein